MNTSTPQSTAVRTRLREAPPLGVAVVSGAIVLLVQVTAIFAYLDIQQPTLTSFGPMVYPVVWITAGIVAAVWVGRTVDSRRQRGLGVAVGGVYTVTLLWLSGILSAGSGTGTLMVQSTLPGWGPIVHYHGSLAHLSIVPFELIAYLTLGYIVYVLVADSGGSVRAAVLGFGSCVSCTASALLAAAGAVGSTQLSSVVATAGYDTATVVLLITYGLLVRASHQATA